jgi:uncharacterized membrane protein
MTSIFRKVHRMLLLSATFVVILLALRFMYTGKLYFSFYVWNLLLAFIPLWISNFIVRQKKKNNKMYVLIGIWLLFLPNAPYLITDVFHFAERPPVPKWFDLLLVISAAWTGLTIGLVSLLQIEQYFLQYYSLVKVNIILSVLILLCSFGVYLGRYLRFNSWDIISNPDDILLAIAHRILFPLEHPKTWGFTLLFSILLIIVYQTQKSLLFISKQKTADYIHTNYKV